MDREQFDRLYSSTFDRVYRYALAITGNQASAEEVAQEAFVRLFCNGVGADTIERPEAWVIRVVRNLAIEVLRNRSRNEVFLDQPARDNPEREAYSDEVYERIVVALSSLPQLQRECIALREFAGLTYREIGTLLEISVDHVKVQIFRARQHLKKQLGDVL